MTQRDRLRQFFDEGNTLDRLDAWGVLGILEAPARISELRSEGYPIETKMVTVMNRYGEKVRVARWTKTGTPSTCPKCLGNRIEPGFVGMTPDCSECNGQGVINE